MFVLSRREYDSPRGIATLQSCFHLCFYVNVLRGQRVRELSLKEHLQETRLARRCQYVRFCSCTFVGTFVLTQCGITPAIELRSLLGYLRITRSFFPVTLFVIGHGHRSTLHTSGSFLCGSWK